MLEEFRHWKELRRLMSKKDTLWHQCFELRQKAKSEGKSSTAIDEIESAGCIESQLIDEELTSMRSF
jgi:hypothetical protein